ncbi:MAG TPA: hypothetical protein VKA06_08155 [Spirochaetia bacterium]|nr:hypothetical protein [Spirochaetia bacterium]
MHDTLATRSNLTLSLLQQREREGRPVSVAIVGAGAYGRTLISQLVRMPGLRAAAVCDLDPEAGRAAYRDAGIDDRRIRVAENGVSLGEATDAGVPVVVPDIDLLAEIRFDVIVDCTGVPDVGARLATLAANGGSDLVMVNVESDATVGVEAAALVERAGGVYTLADGDQPSLIVGLADWASAIGFEVTAAGKWTDSHTQESAAEILASWHRSGKAVSESDITYLDGSKAQIELASTANCLGFLPDTPGMHGPATPLSALPESFRCEGGTALFGRTGVVDFVNCAGLAPHECHPGGVFVIARSENRIAMDAMARKNCLVSADRLHVAFYRPYHLIGAETVRSVVEAAIHRRPTAAPLPKRSVEVVAVAKKSLGAGARLGGLGTDVRGVLVDYREAREKQLLPVGLANDCVAIEDIDENSWLTTDDVTLSDQSVSRGFRPEYGGRLS